MIFGQIHYDSTITLGSIIAAVSICITIVSVAIRIAWKMREMVDKVDKRLAVIEMVHVEWMPKLKMMYENGVARKAIEDYKKEN